MNQFRVGLLAACSCLAACNSQTNNEIIVTGKGDSLQVTYYPDHHKKSAATIKKGSMNGPCEYYFEMEQYNKPA